MTATRFESMKATNDNGIDWMARARAYAAKVERAVQGSKGSGQLMAMIRLVYNRFPLSPEQLRQIVQEYSDDCLPPWNDAEIDHAIASIRKIPSKELWLTEGNTSRKPNKPKQVFATVDEIITAYQRRGPCSAIWTYRDPQGEPVGLVLRWDTGIEKMIFPAAKLPDGMWHMSAMPQPRTLYRFPELLQSTGTVHIPAGEKCADAMAALGYVVTTWAGGELAVRFADWQHLAGKHIVIWADNDKTGIECSKKLAKLLELGASVKVVYLPFLESGEDVYDLIERHREDGKDDAEIKASLDAIVNEAEPYKAKPPEEASKHGGAADAGDDDRILLSDMGNGKRFASDHGKIARYCHPWKVWVFWTGAQWRIDDTGMAMALAKKTISGLFTWTERKLALLAADESPDAALKVAKVKAVLDFALKSQHTNRLSAMIGLAKSEPGIPILPEQFDQHAMLLNVANGTLDLKSGILQPHRQEDYITKICPVRYNPKATCPVFVRTVNSILANDAAVIEYFKRFMGYALTGDTREHVGPIPHGGGSNGKTLIFSTIMDVMGSDFAGTVPPELLMETNTGQHPTIKADLFGKRLMVAAETQQGGRLNEERVKALSGSDIIKARRMKEDFWDFRPTHKLILMTNHRPEIRGDDHGIWRRLALWPFTVKYWDADKGEKGPPELQADKMLPQKLKAEHEGILTWLVEGCLEWQRDGMVMPAAVSAATKDYRSAEDRLGSFLSERCKLNPEFRVKMSDIYTAFKAWAKSNGEAEISSKAFGEAMKARGFTKDDGRRYYLGVVLADQDEEENY